MFHQGHERVILVMTFEEGKRFLCVWLLYCVSNFCRFANGARCQDIDQVLLHGDHFSSVHSAAFFFLSFRQKYFHSEQTADCSLLVSEEKSGRSEVNLLLKASQIIRSILRPLRR